MKILLVVAALSLCGPAALGQEYQAGSLAILHPYARPTALSQPTGGGYLRVINTGSDDRLVSASAPVAQSVQLHSMLMEGDVMRMREVAAIELPAGQTVDLKPGGWHLMFVGLKAPLAVGQSFPVRLVFEKAGIVTVEVKVEVLGAADMRHDKAH
jgi:copper(I)-binding protein